MNNRCFRGKFARLPLTEKHTENYSELLQPPVQN